MGGREPVEALEQRKGVSQTRSAADLFHWPTLRQLVRGWAYGSAGPVSGCAAAAQLPVKPFEEVRRS